MYTACGLGGLLVSTGASGVSASTAGAPRCCFGLHAAQTALLLALQAAALAALFLDPSLHGLPHDATGEEDKTARFVRAHLQRVRAVLLSALLLQLLSLALAGLLATLTREEADRCVPPVGLTGVMPARSFSHTSTPIRSDDEDDWLPPRARPYARPRINLSGESRLAAGSESLSDRLLPPPGPDVGISYSQLLRERYALGGVEPLVLPPPSLSGDDSPARPRRLTPEEALQDRPQPRNEPHSQAACAFM